LDIVKIDVDGSEFDVLFGMQRALCSLRPRLVIIEIIDDHLRRAGSSPAEMLKLMADCGYGVAGETARDVLFTTRDTADRRAVSPGSRSIDATRRLLKLRSGSGGKR
jgi:hypothetical protein